MEEKCVMASQVRNLVDIVKDEKTAFFIWQSIFDIDTVGSMLTFLRAFRRYLSTPTVITSSCFKT